VRRAENTHVGQRAAGDDERRPDGGADHGRAILLGRTRVPIGHVRRLGGHVGPGHLASRVNSAWRSRARPNRAARSRLLHRAGPRPHVWAGHHSDDETVVVDPVVRNADRVPAGRAPESDRPAPLVLVGLPGGPRRVVQRLVAVEQEPHSSLRRSASGRLPELVRQVFQVDLADLDVPGAGDAEDRRPGNLAAEGPAGEREAGDDLLGADVEVADP
jgi:hypothetical protein